MVLDPLAEVVVGMLVSIRIGSSQLMVHVLGNRERRNGKEQQDQADGEPGSQSICEIGERHTGGCEYHNRKKPVN